MISIIITWNPPNKKLHNHTIPIRLNAIKNTKNVTIIAQTTSYTIVIVKNMTAKANSTFPIATDLI